MSFSTWLSTYYEERGLVKWLAFFLEVIAALTLLILMSITCIDVVGRYVFNNSLDAATEFTEISIAILIFASMPVVTWRGGQVVVDILDKFLGDKLVKILSILSIFIMSASLYYVAHRIFFIGARSIRRGEHTEYAGFLIGYLMQYIAIMCWVTAATVATYGIYILLFPRSPKEPLYSSQSSNSKENK